MDKVLEVTLLTENITINSAVLPTYTNTTYDFKLEGLLIYERVGSTPYSVFPTFHHSIKKLDNTAIYIIEIVIDITTMFDTLDHITGFRHKDTLERA